MTRHHLLAWLTLLAPTAASAARLAVLELRNASPLAPAEVRYLTERVRAVAQARTSDALHLITRANLLALLPPGRDLADCEGECEVETGRLIGADFVVGGEVVTLGPALRVVLTLHTTGEGRQLAAVHAGGAQVLDLEQDLVRAADRLFDAVPGLRPGSTAAPAPRAAAPSAPPPPAPPPPAPPPPPRPPGPARVVAFAPDGTPCTGPVQIDGQTRGPAPWQGELALGRHAVEVGCGHRTAREVVYWQGEGELAIEARDARIQLGLEVIGTGGWELAYTGWFADRGRGRLRAGLELHGGRFPLAHVDSGYEDGAWHVGLQLRLALGLAARWDWTLDLTADVAWSGCTDDAEASSDCARKDASDTFDLFPLVGGSTGLRYDAGPLAFDGGVWLLKAFMYRGPEATVTPWLGASVQF